MLVCACVSDDAWNGMACRSLQVLAEACRELQGLAGTGMTRRDLQGLAATWRDLHDLRGLARTCRDLHDVRGVPEQKFRKTRRFVFNFVFQILFQKCGIRNQCGKSRMMLSRIGILMNLYALSFIER